MKPWLLLVMVAGCWTPDEGARVRSPNAVAPSPSERTRPAPRAPYLLFQLLKRSR